MTRGVFLFCHDNAAVDYHKLAYVCAYHVKKYLGVDVCVAGDIATLDKLRSLAGHENLVDHYMEIDAPSDNSYRGYWGPKGTSEDQVGGSFLNGNHHNIYDLTPFDETIKMDLDYLIYNDRLNDVWGSDAPIRMNHKFTSIFDDGISVLDVHPTSIPMYWATVVYFRKDEETKLFFDLIDYVKGNYAYFSRQYNFSSSMYRNDFSFSVAAHIMNGSVGVNGPQWPVQSLPEPVTLFAWDQNPILKYRTDKVWFDGKRKETDMGTVICSNGLSVHVLNKRSILERVYPNIHSKTQEAFE